MQWFDGLFEGKLVRWKLLYYFSFLLFISSTLFIPFDKTISVLILFFLIGLWSRIPGMIAFFAHPMEIFDVLIISIAININPLFAGVFGFFGILIPKLFAPQEWFPYVIRHSIARFFSAFSVPWAYAYFDGSFIPVFIVFTIVDWIIYLALGPFIEPGGFAGFIAGLPYDIMVIPAELIYTALIGPPLNMLISVILSGGVSFNMTLFLIGGAILSLMYFTKGIKQYQQDKEAGKEGSLFYKKVEYILSFEFIFHKKEETKISAYKIIQSMKTLLNPLMIHKQLLNNKKELLLNQKALNFILMDNIDLINSTSLKRNVRLTGEEIDKMKRNLIYINDELNKKEASFNKDFFKIQEEIYSFLPDIQQEKSTKLNPNLVMEKNPDIKSEIEKKDLSFDKEIIAFKKKYAIKYKTQESQNLNLIEVIIRNRTYSIPSKIPIERYLFDKKKEVYRFISQGKI